ncbi:MAG: hypothetical protein OHK0038_09330 [Flammeovirgaceae bacterium]
MKKVLFLLALILAIYAQQKLSANPIKDTEKTTAVAAIEEELIAEISLDELFANEEEVIAQMVEASRITEVLVYDMKGNLLHAQKEDIDYSKIPSNAVLTVTDGHVQYYIVQ